MPPLVANYSSTSPSRLMGPDLDEARAAINSIRGSQITATLGATYTLATAGLQNVELIGTLGPFETVPTSTVTLTGISAGLRVWIRVRQPNPGGCALRLSDGGAPTVIPIAAAANKSTLLLVSSINGTDLDVVVLGDEP